MWDYGLCEWKDVVETELSPKPSEEILRAVGEDMHLIWAYINDDTMEVDFESIDIMNCGCEVVELMERIGFKFTDNPQNGLRCVYE